MTILSWAPIITTRTKFGERSFTCRSILVRNILISSSHISFLQISLSVLQLYLWFCMYSLFQVYRYQKHKTKVEEDLEREQSGPPLPLVFTTTRLKATQQQPINILPDSWNKLHSLSSLTFLVCFHVTVVHLRRRRQNNNRLSDGQRQITITTAKGKSLSDSIAHL